MNPVIKILHILQWIIIGLLQLPLILFGAFVVIPLALLLKINMKKLPLWGNAEEDTPQWFFVKAANSWYRRPWPNWWWYAVRNPLNNLRFVFDDTGSFDIEGWEEQSMEAHDLMIANITSASRWTYRSAYAGYRRIWLTGDTTYSEIWFGWKVGSSVPGMGFTMQVRINRDIGT